MAAAGKNHRATIRDVAQAAGVSHATVSRYLNRHSYVSEEAGSAIEDALAQVRYVPNLTARSLVSRKTFSVACIVREHSDLFFADPNLSALAVGANSVLSDAGYQMMILIVEGDSSAKRVTELIAGGAVDGAILLAMLENDPVVVELAKSGTPLVSASVPLRGSAIPVVDTDNEGGTRAITERLLKTGRKRVAEIRGPRGHPVSGMRHSGFCAALGGLYDDRLVEEVDEWTPKSGAVAMQRLLETEPNIDGVVAASDALAAGAITVLDNAGRRIPGDVGIVGFDDSTWATQTRPNLSTVHQDAKLTGQRMSQLLLRQMDGEDLSGWSEIIPNKIVWRESA